MHISPAPHYLKVHLTRREWQMIPFAHREQIKYLCQRVSEGNYETYCFVPRTNWQKVRQYFPGLKDRMHRHPSQS